MFKSNFKSLSIIAITIILTLGLSISFQSLLASWIAPSSPAPGGNVAAPINAGPFMQEKEGPLLLVGNATTTDSGASLIVEKGKTLIGSRGLGAQAYYKLEVSNMDDDAYLTRDYQARFFQTDIADAYLIIGADHNNALVAAGSYDSSFHARDLILQPNSLSEIGQVGIGATSTNSDIKLYIDGKVGAKEYCDEDGNNCVAGDSLGLPTGCADGDYLRYDSVNGWECSGPPGPPGTYGFFLRSEITYDGDLIGWATDHYGYSGTDGLDAADLICYNEITSNDFKDKPATIGWGKVHAFLCQDTSSCNSLQINTTYQFGVIGNVGLGGATFTTDSQGLGPYNLDNWDGSLYFNEEMSWWTGRNFVPGDTYWPHDGVFDPCNNGLITWNSTSDATDGWGRSWTAVGQEYIRWSANISNLCSEKKFLICYIDP